MKGERLQRCRVVDGEMTLERGQMLQVPERSGLLGTPKRHYLFSLQLLGGEHPIAAKNKLTMRGFLMTVSRPPSPVLSAAVDLSSVQ